MPKRYRKSLNRTTYTRSKATAKTTERKKSTVFSKVARSPSTAESLNRTYTSEASRFEVSVLQMAPSDTDSTSSLGRLWKKDTSIRDRISVSGAHPVHGYRSHHLQLADRIGEQYFADGTV